MRIRVFSGVGALSFALRNCLVFDAERGVLLKRDVEVRDGVIVRLGGLEGPAESSMDLSGRIVVPRLVDLHTHVYRLATSLGVDPDKVSEHTGVGVLVDAGSSGAGNFGGLREYVIKRSRRRVVAFLNISFGGIPFFGLRGGREQVGEIPSMAVLDEEACVRCVERNRKHIVGVKVRVSRNVNGEHGTEPVKVAKRCAEKLGLPLMVHFGAHPPYLADILKHLGRGDILTHCFHPAPNTLLEDKQTLRAVSHAREKGVILDVGHGLGSFSFEVAKRSFEQGLLPDTVSTDLHRYNVGGPVYDLPTTMSKMLALGLPLEKLLAAVTKRPAEAVGLGDLSRIVVGVRADLVVLEVRRGRYVFEDSVGQKITAERFVAPYAEVVGGKIRPLNYEVPAGVCIG